MRTLRVLTAFTAAVLATGLAACSSGSPSSTAPATSAASTAASGSGAGTTQIVISNFGYQPADLTVKPGQQITVVNKDATAHTVTATSGHAFDTGTIGGGKSATFTAPSRSGAYPYICTIHQFMHGTLTVR